MQSNRLIETFVKFRDFDITMTCFSEFILVIYFRSLTRERL